MTIKFFSSKSCNACKMMYPIIENLKKDGYEIKQYIIDNDEDLLVAQSYGISAVPTMIINEKIYLVGYRPESEIRKNLKV